MRVLHVVATTEILGGAQAHVLDLAAAQRARGDEVDIVPGAELSAVTADVVHVHAEPPIVLNGTPAVRSLHDFAFGCATGEKWFRGGAECGRAHGPGCLAAIAARGCTHSADPRPALRRYATVGRTLPAVRAAASVVVYSEYVRGVAVKNGIPPERCRVAPYFVRRPATPAPPAQGRTIAFVGRLVHRKGLDVLLHALAQRPGAWDELLVVGDGWDRERCEGLARRLGVGARTRFLGWLGREGVTDVLRQSGIVALPSRWPEPFGIVGLEAMAAARPVVASAVGGIPEWLDDAETGILVPPGDAGALGDAVARLLADEGLRRALGEEAWRRVERFSAEAHLAELDAAYAEAAR